MLDHGKTGEAKDQPLLGNMDVPPGEPSNPRTLSEALQPGTRHGRLVSSLSYCMPSDSMFHGAGVFFGRASRRTFSALVTLSLYAAALECLAMNHGMLGEKVEAMMGTDSLELANGASIELAFAAFVTTMATVNLIMMTPVRALLLDKVHGKVRSLSGNAGFLGGAVVGATLGADLNARRGPERTVPETTVPGEPGTEMQKFTDGVRTQAGNLLQVVKGLGGLLFSMSQAFLRPNLPALLAATFAAMSLGEELDAEFSPTLAFGFTTLFMAAALEEMVESSITHVVEPCATRVTARLSRSGGGE